MVVYEVRCHHCDVSFPPATRRCIHCGGKTGEILAPTQPSQLPTFSWTEAAEGPQPTPLERELAAEPVGDEVEPGRRSLLGTVMSLFWVLLLVVGYLFRSCTS